MRNILKIKNNIRATNNSLKINVIESSEIPELKSNIETSNNAVTKFTHMDSTLILLYSSFMVSPEYEITELFLNSLNELGVNNFSGSIGDIFTMEIYIEYFTLVSPLITPLNFPALIPLLALTRLKPSLNTVTASIYSYGHNFYETIYQFDQSQYQGQPSGKVPVLYIPEYYGPGISQRRTVISKYYTQNGYNTNDIFFFDYCWANFQVPMNLLNIVISNTSISLIIENILSYIDTIKASTGASKVDIVVSSWSSYFALSARAVTTDIRKLVIAESIKNTPQEFGLVPTQSTEEQPIMLINYNKITSSSTNPTWTYKNLAVPPFAIPGDYFIDGMEIGSKSAFKHTFAFLNSVDAATYPFSMSGSSNTVMLANSAVVSPLYNNPIKTLISVDGYDAIVNVWTSVPDLPIGTQNLTKGLNYGAFNSFNNTDIQNFPETEIKMYEIIAQPTKEHAGSISPKTYGYVSPGKTDLNWFNIFIPSVPSSGPSSGPVIYPPNPYWSLILMSQSSVTNPLRVNNSEVVEFWGTTYKSTVNMTLIINAPIIPSLHLVILKYRDNTEITVPLPAVSQILTLILTETKGDGGNLDSLYQQTIALKIPGNKEAMDIILKYKDSKYSDSTQTVTVIRRPNSDGIVSAYFRYPDQF